jgi:hypothetical protein
LTKVRTRSFLWSSINCTTIRLCRKVSLDNSPSNFKAIPLREGKHSFPTTQTGSERRKGGET